VSYSSEILADSPAGYWNLDDLTGSSVLADSSGNALDASLVGTYTLQSPTLLDKDSLYGVDFTNARGTTASSALLKASGANEATWEAWVKTTSTGIRAIIGSDNATTRFFQFRLNSGKVEIVLFNGASATTKTTTATVNDGNRHHIAVVCDGTQVQFYIDGQPSGSSQAFTWTANTSNHAFALANQLIGVTASPFVGTLDEIAFYPSALSASRILAHYNAGAAAVYTDSATVSTVTVVNGIESSDTVDSSTVTTVTTPNGGDIYTPAGGGNTTTDSATIAGVTTPAGTDEHGTTDSATIASKTSPSGSDVYTPAPIGETATISTTTKVNTVEVFTHEEPPVITAGGDTYVGGAIRATISVGQTTVVEGGGGTAPGEPATDPLVVVGQAGLDDGDSGFVPNLPDYKL